MKTLSYLSLLFVLFFISCDIGDDIVEDYVEPSITILENSNPIPKNLLLNETYLFSANFINDVGEIKNDLITWKSSNTGAITINSKGLAKAVGLGTSKIEVTAINNNPKTNVETPISKEVASITINEVLQIGNTISEIALNDTHLYSIKYFGEETISWASSDSSKATIDDGGIITAIGLGEVTISVSVTENGETYSKEIMVTVTGVTLRISNPITSLSPGSTHQYIVDFSGDNDPTITWASSNTAIATINSSGLVTAIAVGNITITATTTEAGVTLTNTTMLEVIVPVINSRTGTLQTISYGVRGEITLTSTMMTITNFNSTAPDTNVYLTNNPNKNQNDATDFRVTTSGRITSNALITLPLNNIDINQYSHVVITCRGAGNFIMGKAELQ